jgi:hypothetical protein
MPKSEDEAPKGKKGFHRLPVVSAGAEFLVMGYLMRRDILTYKAPPNNEGYDLICIHPDPRHRAAPQELSQVRVQVKSRYATDCDRGFPVKKKTLDAFDFLVIAFLNIGNYFSKERDGSMGSREVEFFTLPNAFLRDRYLPGSKWDKVSLRGSPDEIEPFRNELGFELIAKSLGIAKPTRKISPAAAASVKRAK